MTPAEFWLMAGYLQVEAEDREKAMKESQEKAEEEAARKSGKHLTRIKGPGLDPSKLKRTHQEPTR